MKRETSRARRGRFLHSSCCEIATSIYSPHPSAQGVAMTKRYILLPIDTRRNSGNSEHSCGEFAQRCNHAVDSATTPRQRLPLYLVEHFFLKVLAILAVLAGSAVVSPPAFAHHGSSAYDFTKLITLKATVTSLEWGNPHCILHFDSKDEKGAVTPWSLEMYNPLWMARAGWNKATLKPGDEIVVTFSSVQECRRERIYPHSRKQDCVPRAIAQSR